MTDTSANNLNEEAGKREWLTPQIAAGHLGISLRATYRLIERGTLVSDGAKHGQKITLASVEAAKLRLFAEDAANHDFDRQDAKGKAKAGPDENRASVMALMSLTADRDKALAKADKAQERLEELLELRRQDALELGKLQERVAQLEERLKEARQSVNPPGVTQALPQPTPAPIPAQPAKITPAVVEPPQPAQEPQNRGFWRRLLGG